MIVYATKRIQYKTIAKHLVTTRLSKWYARMTTITAEDINNCKFSNFSKQVYTNQYYSVTAKTKIY